MRVAASSALITVGTVRRVGDGCAVDEPAGDEPVVTGEPPGVNGGATDVDGVTDAGGFPLDNVPVAGADDEPEVGDEAVDEPLDGTADGEETALEDALGCTLTLATAELVGVSTLASDPIVANRVDDGAAPPPPEQPANATPAAISTLHTRRPMLDAPFPPTIPTPPAQTPPRLSTPSTLRTSTRVPDTSQMTFRSKRGAARSDRCQRLPAVRRMRTIKPTDGITLPDR